jgi:hypothetical protein
MRAAIATQYAVCSSMPLSEIASLAESRVFTGIMNNSPRTYLDSTTSSPSGTGNAP